MKRPLLETWPVLSDRLPWVKLGELPTPVESLTPVMSAAGHPEAEAWIKRDDLTSPLYGGNKVRTLEVLFGQAIDQGATHIYSTGAFGSNHAAATVLHAPQVGLKPGVLLFPQPCSHTAADNLKAVLGQQPQVRALPHWSTLPYGMWRTRRAHQRQGHRPVLMAPGGATPLGAMGYISAALELGGQIAAGLCPAPDAIVVGLGSTCTSAGLLVGLHHAARLGIGFKRPPQLIAVRVTPWPVTAPVRVAWLARRASRLLARLTDDPSLAIPLRTLRRSLTVDGGFLGAGYGLPTPAGREAISLFSHMPGLTLDTTYSAKAAAAVLHRVRHGERRTILYWATKSSAPLPAADPPTLKAAPRLMKRWLKGVERLD